MTETLITTGAEETRSFGKKLAREIMPGALICLKGDLGTGKTTFAQGFLEGLGAARPYVSPTFVIMKQYDLPQAKNGIKRVYHADAYRVETKDFVSLGFSEWCTDTEGVVILEWPERVEKLIPKNAVWITFTAKSENERELKIEN
ncbi:MAG: tRNA (adenosine(37)-N6)-threonylcarbamoyltransferase complex ATPase subunit type 1 TsaE [Candidatus Moranbacteria bacterium]|nr:tRNA (adenosine(37)-N6)-threonylcarbamoyltransferase complex ATPase subunit type 1 TsaE [Candidatus Moranbacteria bacterium]